METPAKRLPHHPRHDLGSTAKPPLGFGISPGLAARGQNHPPLDAAVANLEKPWLF
jgi:hypothetical protein